MEVLAAVASLLSGESRGLLVTGSAGTGKSHALGQVVDALRRRGVPFQLTAATGTATQVMPEGATTLHRFLGLRGGPRESDEVVMRRASKDRRRQAAVQAVEVLVVDEVSMLSADLLERASRVAGVLREHPGEPWGGMRVVLVGDFLQIPPVRARGRPAPRLAFEAGAGAWAAVDRAVVLTTVHRARDPPFAELLARARRGALTPDDLGLLAARHVTEPWPPERAAAEALAHPKGPPVAPKLFTERAKVREFNERAVHAMADAAAEAAAGAADAAAEAAGAAAGTAAAAAAGAAAEAAAEGVVPVVRVAPVVRVHWPKGRRPETPRLEERALEVLEDLGGVAPELALVPGMPLMLTRNLDVERGLVNGAVGRVLAVEGRPELVAPELEDAKLLEAERAADPVILHSVMLPQGFRVRVQFRTATVCLGYVPTALRGVLAPRVLVLAWSIPAVPAFAMTIHKAQGATLERARVDLSNPFDYGMAYVALSRVRSLEDLELETPPDAAAFRAHPAALAFYDALETGATPSEAAEVARGVDAPHTGKRRLGGPGGAGGPGGSGGGGGAGGGGAGGGAGAFRRPRTGDH